MYSVHDLAVNRMTIAVDRTINSMKRDQHKQIRKWIFIGVEHRLRGGYSEALWCTSFERNYYRFISKEYISIRTRLIGETKNKATKTYAQSGQYHTITKSRDS